VRPQDPAAATAKRYADNIKQHGGIQSYGVRSVANYIKTIHSSTNPTPHQLPTIASTVLQKVKSELGPVATNAPGANHAAFSPFKDFRTRSLSKAPSSPTRAPPTPPTLDFHQMVSSLGDYPLVLRRLGLIIDLEIPLAAGLPKDSQLRLSVSANNPQPALALAAVVTASSGPQPWTAYQLTNSGFFAKPRSAAGPGSMANGVFNLNGVNDSHSPDAANPFEVVQIDVDALARSCSI
jgi:hypothetical protein